VTDAALLLADPHPALRRRVLLELFDAPPDDPEVAAAEVETLAHPEVSELLEPGEDLAWNLVRLGYLGLGREHPGVAALAERLLASQRSDGSWDLPPAHQRSNKYQMVPLQTALPLRGLIASGYASDPRVERAFEWLLERQLPDGAWPTGYASGHFGFVAGYRKLSGSAHGCRSNTLGVVACLVGHPERASAPATRAALDLLLGGPLRDEAAFGSEVARLRGVEPATGFFTFYGPADPGLLLALAAGAGYSEQDARIHRLAEFVRGKRGRYHVWAHPVHPQLHRWLSFDLMRSLRLVERGAVIGHDLGPRRGRRRPMRARF
jgi:hypothetical protein